MRTIAILLLAASCASTEPADDGISKAEAQQQADEGKTDGIDWCELRDWYDDGDCDRFCARHDNDCGLLGADPRGTPARYPVVLHHGFAAGHGGPFAWRGVAEAIRSTGTKAYVTQVPPFDAIRVRVQYLKQTIDTALAQSGAGKVNIIAHSMGGLDARHLISALGYGDRVASLTTISTPHRGTNAADFGLKITPGVADPAVDALARILGAQINDFSQRADIRSALTDLSEANSPAFNSAHRDDARVYYQSYAGVSSLLGLGRDRNGGDIAAACQNKLDYIAPGSFDRYRLLFAPVAPIIGHGIPTKKPHDGLVTVESSVWGNFRGCIPADHSDEVGQLTAGRPDPRTSWDPDRFYLQVVDELAARGF